MYILKNALRCISRSKGRNVLIGIIVLVIAISSCIGLSIRQAAENAKEETLAGMSVTANISFDRSSAMKDMQIPNATQGGQPPSFDKDSFKELMGEASSLSLDDYLKYTKAESVNGYYYSARGVLNYADFATGKSAVLCAKPGCTHVPDAHGNNPCDAEMPFNGRYMFFEKS